MRTPVPTARQKVELTALVRARRIEAVPVDLARAEGFLTQAEDALADVPNLTRPQNAYNLAYDAAHDVGEAMLAAFGYRTASGRGQHEALGRFLVAIFDEWLDRDVGRVFVQDVDVALGALFGRYSLCVHAPECGDALAMEHNGDVYSCDHYVEPHYRLGNVARDDFAARVGVSVGHLRNIAYGSKPCSAEHAIAIEVASGSRVRVEPLCPGLDWAAFWAGRAASAQAATTESA